MQGQYQYAQPDWKICWLLPVDGFFPRERSGFQTTRLLTQAPTGFRNAQTQQHPRVSRLGFLLHPQPQTVDPLSLGSDKGPHRDFVGRSNMGISTCPRLTRMGRLERTTQGWGQMHLRTLECQGWRGPELVYQSALLQ